MKKFKLFLHVSFFPSGPSDKASKLAQLVEKNLENYYKTDEKSQIKVESELKCFASFFVSVGKKIIFGICFDNRFYKTRCYLLIKATSCDLVFCVWKLRKGSNWYRKSVCKLICVIKLIVLGKIGPVIKWGMIETWKNVNNFCFNIS